MRVLKNIIAQIITEVKEGKSLGTRLQLLKEVKASAPYLQMLGKRIISSKEISLSKDITKMLTKMNPLTTKALRVNMITLRMQLLICISQSSKRLEMR